MSLLYSVTGIFATFHPSLSPSARAAVFAQVDALLRAQRVPGLRGWCVGPPVGVVASGGKESSGGGERDGGEEEVQNLGDTREGMIAGNERAEGRDFGFAAEFEDMDAFRASLPHEWHHEIYRLVKRVTVGKFFIYQIDTERGRGWRAAPPGVDRRGDERGELGRDERRELGRGGRGELGRDERGELERDGRGEPEADVGVHEAGLGRGGGEEEAPVDGMPSMRDDNVSARRPLNDEDETPTSESHTWHARGWREERRWRARL
ncbi:hypothetical protein EV122DRAFT_251952 [Schizophyllum commune]